MLRKLRLKQKNEFPIKKRVLQPNIILTDTYKRKRYKYLNSALKWCRARKDEICALSSYFDVMSWILCLKINKFSYFYDPLPSNVTHFQGASIWPHILKLNYEKLRTGSLSDKNTETYPRPLLHLRWSFCGISLWLSADD